MINKRGSLYSVIAIMGTVLLVMSFFFMFVLGGSIVKDTMGTVFTEVRAIGNVTDNVNTTVYSNIVFEPVETILNNYSTYAAVLYIFGIILIFTLAFIFRDNMSPLTMSLFVVSALLIIVFAIVLSNTYEEFYNGSDFIGTALHEATLSSYLILYSPAIMTIVVFVAGIILMSGKQGGYT